MGGFPALQINNQQPSPIAEYAQIEQIKASQQQQQATALQIKQEQQNLTDQHAVTQAMLNWDGKDPNSLAMGVLRNGGSGQAVFGVTQKLLATKQAIGEIAKNDSITAQNNAETMAKQNDAYRGRLLNIAGIKDPAAQQTAWDNEVTKEEQAGTVKPGQMSHTYPGNEQATILANSFAVGSQLVKEAQERQKMSLEAWKPSGGTLVNAITGERIGGIDPSQIPLINKGFDARYQVLHPGETAPDYFQLKPGASPTDFDRVDKLLEATEKGAATKAQQDIVNAMRSQTFELQRDKTDMNPVVGTDKNGRQVLAPLSQAQQAGVQNPMKADADMVNKALAARHWLSLANTQAPADAKPEEMGIMQLVDKLDSEGKLGKVASRWNEFMAGKVGAGDPDVAALRAKMGLSTTLLMQAHVGSRGSAQMLEHFEDLANQKKLDGPTLKAALGAEVNYVQDKAMDPNPPDYSKVKGKSAKPELQSKPPAGATHKVQGPDGKMHYTNAQGTVDMGIVP
jgi:hypothetical protein